MTDGNVTFEYFEPTVSLFRALDNDMPDFAVGVHIPTLTAFSGGAVTAHLYIWERGSTRDVTLYSPFGLGGARRSRSVLRKLVAEYVAADPRLTQSITCEGISREALLAEKDTNEEEDRREPEEAPAFEGGSAPTPNARTVMLARGQNMPLPDAAIQVALEWAEGAGDDLDISAVLCNADGRAFDAESIVFFNQPVGAYGSVRLNRRARLSNGVTAGSLTVSLPGVPGGIGRVVVAGSLDGTGASAFKAVQGLRATVYTGKEMLAQFPLTFLTTETAVVVVEIYRRAGGWRLRAVGQGWDNGFASLLRDHGIDVED
ncbi:MAG: TerD family protein [Frankia sp.]|nr:TerD family protein [Frankia sp.]